MSSNEIFKQHYETIIKNFDPVFYDDQYMSILTGKNTTIKLDNVSKTNKIKPIKRDNEILNTFDNSLVSNFEGYSKLLILSKKIIMNFIDDTAVMYLPYQNPLLMEIKYLSKKYFDTEPIVILDTRHYENIKKFETDKLKLDQINYSVKNSTNDLLDSIKPQNMIIYVNELQAIYKYYTNVETFIEMYNKIIKLPKGNYTIAIKIKADFYLELIFDVIDILRKYFKTIYLTNTKYYPRYSFMVILKDKIQNHNKDNDIKFDNKLYRLVKEPINEQYVKFMNTLYEKRAEKIMTFMAIDKMRDTNKEYYDLILSRIQNYKYLE